MRIIDFWNFVKNRIPYIIGFFIVLVAVVSCLGCTCIRDGVVGDIRQGLVNTEVTNEKV